MLFPGGHIRAVNANGTEPLRPTMGALDEFQRRGLYVDCIH